MPIVPSPRETGYRNKAQYPVALVHGKATAGFFRPRTHQVLDVGRCRIQGSAADRAKDTVVRWMRDNRVAPYDEKTRPGPGAPYLRPHGLDHRPGAGVPGGERRRHPQEMALVENLLKNVDNLGTVVLSIHKKPGNAVLGDRFRTLYGPGYIEDRLLRIDLPPVAPVLLPGEPRPSPAALRGRRGAGGADRHGDRGGSLLRHRDHFSGAGPERAGRVIGVEIIDQAVADARENARRNGLTNAEFRCADASQAAAQLAAEGIRPDVIVVDPPRKGLDETVIDAMARMAPDRIVYISLRPPPPWPAT